MRVKLLRIKLTKTLKSGRLEELLDAIGTVLETRKLTEEIVMAGEMPAWAQAAVVAYLVPREFIAIYEPSVEGAIVIFSFRPDVRIGEVIPREELEDLDTLGVIF